MLHPKQTERGERNDCNYGVTHSTPKFYELSANEPQQMLEYEVSSRWTRPPLRLNSVRTLRQADFQGRQAVRPYYTMRDNPAGPPSMFAFVAAHARD